MAGSTASARVLERCEALSRCSEQPDGLTRVLSEANGHRADENLKLDDLHKASEVVALSLYDLLSRPAT